MHIAACRSATRRRACAPSLCPESRSAVPLRAPAGLPPTSCRSPRKETAPRPRSSQSLSTTSCVALPSLSSTAEEWMLGSKRILGLVQKRQLPLFARDPARREPNEPAKAAREMCLVEVTRRDGHVAWREPIAQQQGGVSCASDLPQGRVAH